VPYKPLHPHFHAIQTVHLRYIGIFRVGQNHLYTVYIRYFWQGKHQIYGHIRCIYTVLANFIQTVHLRYIGILHPHLRTILTIASSLSCHTNITSTVYWYIASSKLTRYCQMYRNLSTSHVYCVLTFVSYKHVTPFGCLCSLSSARTDSVLTHFLPRVNILGLTFNACMILLTHPAPCLMNG
jgi:hypothetical protein